MFNALLGAVVITTANRTIFVKEGANPAVGAQLTTGVFFLRGDGTSDDLVKNISDALNAATPATYTVTLSASVLAANPAARLTITCSTAVVLQLTTGAGTTFDPRLIGWPSAVTASSTTHTSPLSAAAAWVSTEQNRDLEPFSEKRVSVRRTANGRTAGVERSVRMRSWRLEFGFLPDSRMLQVRNVADPAATLESFMDTFGANARFEVHDLNVTTGDVLLPLTSSTRVTVAVFSEDTLARFEPMRVAPGTPLYRWGGVIHDWVG